MAFLRTPSYFDLLWVLLFVNRIKKASFSLYSDICCASLHEREDGEEKTGTEEVDSESSFVTDSTLADSSQCIGMFL